MTAIGAKFGTEDLTFAQPFTSGNGVLSLRNVGFAAYGAGNRDPDAGKDDDLRLQVTIDALSPDDGTPVTATASLGKDSNTHRESVVLTPLFLAGAMSGVSRFSLVVDTQPMIFGKFEDGAPSSIPTHTRRWVHGLGQARFHRTAGTSITYTLKSSPGAS